MDVVVARKTTSASWRAAGPARTSAEISLASQAEIPQSLFLSSTSTMGPTAPARRGTTGNVRLMDSAHNVFSEGSDDENELDRNGKTDQADVEKMYEKAKKKRTPKPKLQPKELIAALATVPHEFSSKLGVCSKNVTSAARYSNMLVQLYTDLAVDLKTDLNKVQKMGSGKEVREACKLQRMMVTRNPYLEKVLGSLAAKNLLVQLAEYEADQHRQQQEEEEETSPPNDDEEPATTSHPNAVHEPNPTINSTATTHAAATPLVPTTTTTAPEDDSEEEFEFPSIPSTDKGVILEDSDDDDESVSAPTKKRKRQVQEEDSESVQATDVEMETAVTSPSTAGASADSSGLDGQPAAVNTVTDKHAPVPTTTEKEAQQTEKPVSAVDEQANKDESSTIDMEIEPEQIEQQISMVTNQDPVGSAEPDKDEATMEIEAPQTDAQISTVEKQTPAVTTVPNKDAPTATAMEIKTAQTEESIAMQAPEVNNVPETPTTTTMDIESAPSGAPTTDVDTCADPDTMIVEKVVETCDETGQSTIDSSSPLSEPDGSAIEHDAAMASQITILGQPTQDEDSICSEDDEVATIVPSLTMPDSP